jgi:hypothetical protein
MDTYRFFSNTQPAFNHALIARLSVGDVLIWEHPVLAETIK